MPGLRSGHANLCVDYVIEQINENAAAAGEINWGTDVLTATDSVWGINVLDLAYLYLSDGTASCTCPEEN